MRCKKLFVWTFLLLVSSAFSQTTEIKGNRLVSGDCDKAISLLVKSGTSYGPTLPPEGPGKKSEIPRNHNHYFFEAEHNTSWYKLTIAQDGEMVFDIIPIQKTDDYDFMLFKYSETFCNDLLINQQTPIRSNLCNSKRSVEGMSGLSIDANANNTLKGIGNCYSKSIKVVKGEQFILVIDNVSPNGKGYTLTFDCLKEVIISGKIITEDSLPLKGQVVLSDNKGKMVKDLSTYSDGSYLFNAFIKENKNYYVTVSSDSTFYDSKTINSSILKDTNSFPVITSLLPKLKNGGKYKMGNINFYGDVATLLPESWPAVEALSQIMKKNKKMIIEIGGHTNGSDWHLAPQWRDPSEQLLSENRAKVVYDYLLKKGVSADRMSVKGYGSTQPVIYNPTDMQAILNRRVEIRVMSLGN